MRCDAMRCDFSWSSLLCVRIDIVYLVQYLSLFGTSLRSSNYYYLVLFLLKTMTMIDDVVVDGSISTIDS